MINDDEQQFIRILMNHQNIAPIKNTDESSKRDQVLYSVGSMPSYLFMY